jgi:hypothetical protein
MEDKITIIEGPTPEFEDISDGWALGLNESPLLYDTNFTQVRTLNGPALVERCHRAWKENDTIYLHFKNKMGIEEKAPITAVRSVDTDEGQILLLWVRQLPSYSDLIQIADEMSDFDDDIDDDLDDDFDDDLEDDLDDDLDDDLEDDLEDDLDDDFEDDLDDEIEDDLEEDEEIEFEEDLEDPFEEELEIEFDEDDEFEDDDFDEDDELDDDLDDDDLDDEDLI